MKTLLTLTCCLAAFAAFAAPTPKQTDFVPGERWEDNNGNHINAHGGGLLLHEGRVWWFGEHKVAGTAGNQAWVGVHCYSSPADDLVNWRDEGIALRVSKDPKSDIAEGCILERPKVIYNAKTRKFVMWFHLELKGQGYASARSGVAIADTIAGPYTFLRSGRVNPGIPAQNAPEPGSEKAKTYFRDLPGGQMARDMTLYVDTDGTAYHIYASEENSTLQIAELDDTYTKHTGRYWRAFEGRYMEAPALFKRGDTYYFIGSGCTGWAPNAARSAKAPAVAGPWTELGNPARGENDNKTFFSQSTYVLQHPTKPDTYIYCGDRWNPKNQIDSRHIWLPIQWDPEGKPHFTWHDRWSIK